MKVPCGIAKMYVGPQNHPEKFISSCVHHLTEKSMLEPLENMMKSLQTRVKSFHKVNLPYIETGFLHFITVSINF
jgi:hypothetical protein